MRLIIAGALALALAACIASGRQPGEVPGPYLTISRYPSGSMVDRRPLPEDGSFSLSFIHSVSRTPVRDDYRILDCRIVQTAEVFQTHGAGLPSGIDEYGATAWEQQDGRFVLHMNRPISRLIVRIDSSWRNRLHVDGKEIDLARWGDQSLEIATGPCGK